MITSDHPQFEFFRRGQFFGGVEDIADDASTELLPLTRFDCEHLRRTRAQRSEKEAEAALARRIGRSCAGLAPEYRCSAAELRAAIRTGTLDERQRRCFDWTLSGMRSFETHELYNKWELSIWEIARTIAYTYGGRHTLSRWLNLWGTSPSRPLPDYDGLTREERARERGYEIDRRISGRIGPTTIETRPKPQMKRGRRADRSSPSRPMPVQSGLD